ncbi:DUF1963 domain-containing protein [Conexibacter sp. SYSU D00693]|uniref:DUF1963 domain-containing protein n=1 Tax=Conexibacter sp. SYSU D00693 TaxID=2812560 RepID=UPI00196B235B|nr:YwqG family protein [Conexibacter sp. SYSU D00693]
MLSVVLAVAAALAAPGPPGLDRTAIADAAGGAGFGPQADAIAAAALPGVTMERTIVRRAPARRGTSRLGGRPDLPPTTPWPVCQGRPMAFLGQVRLAELPRGYLPELPRAGLLSFFTDVEGEDPGSWLTGGRCSTVMRLPLGRGRLERRATPRRQRPLVLRSARVRLRGHASLPASEDTRVAAPLQHIAISDFEPWFRFREDLRGTREPLHHLGGYADFGQLDPRRWECSRSVPVTKWRLLLQVEWDEPLGFMVGDGGVLFVHVRESDLRAGRFDRLCSSLEQG